MDYIRQIEEDLRNLGIEAKKRYPEVNDATEQGLITLKIMRESYANSIMKKHNNINIIQSSDISKPYILVCNYADCNNKIISIALNGIQMLLNYNIVPPSG